MGDPLYRWIVGWMGWMGWMQCQRNLGMALHKVVHKAREQNLQGRLIKRQWSNYIYIYIHINRLFFYSLVASNMIHFEHFQSIFGMMSFHDQHLFDAFKLPIRVYIPAKSQLRLATFVTEFDTTSFLIVFQKATSTS